ncbi:hypothetical protein CI109_100148 [Kwoniella shandongensis]|uniref:Uncharacterized protein n=1 Tax=Kwoniella shandongensis TaxID=1734106 RepID=A0AAJ8LEA8_9TREE
MGATTYAFEPRLEEPHSSLTSQTATSITAATGTQHHAPGVVRSRSFDPPSFNLAFWELESQAPSPEKYLYRVYEVAASYRKKLHKTHQLHRIHVECSSLEDDYQANKEFMTKLRVTKNHPAILEVDVTLQTVNKRESKSWVQTRYHWRLDRKKPTPKSDPWTHPDKVVSLCENDEHAITDCPYRDVPEDIAAEVLSQVLSKASQSEYAKAGLCTLASASKFMRNGEFENTDNWKGAKSFQPMKPV